MVIFHSHVSLPEGNIPKRAYQIPPSIPYQTYQIPRAGHSPGISLSGRQRTILTAVIQKSHGFVMIFSRIATHLD